MLGFLVIFDTVLRLLDECQAAEANHKRNPSYLEATPYPLMDVGFSSGFSRGFAVLDESNLSST